MPDQPNATIAIVYHSGFGHTKALTDHVEKGAAAVEGATVRVVDAETAAANIDQFDDVDCFIWGSPTYMGGVSAQWKQFADASGKKWLSGEWGGRMAAGYTISGSLHGDKMMTLMYFVTLAMQHRMVWVGMDVQGTATQGSHGGTPEDLNRIGSYMGLMAQADNVDASQSPPEGDRKTAELFGTRVAEYAVRWVRGKA